MSSQTTRGGRGGRGGRGRGGNQNTEEAGGRGGYRATGDAPYQGNRGGRGGRGRGGKGNQNRDEPKPYQQKKNQNSAEDQFNSLFGAPAPKDTKKQAVNDDPALMIDDAIEIQDEAIIVESTPAPSKQRKNSSNIDSMITEGKKKNLNEADLAILKAASSSKPLWMEEEGRVKYSKQEFLELYVPNPNIDFDLFDKNFMDCFEVFNSEPKGPFANEDESDEIDMKRFQERPGGGPKPKAGYLGNKPNWNKEGAKTKPTDENDEDGPDPDWMQFDPEVDKEKFWGNVMHDEQKLRDRVVYKKEQKQQRIAEKKEKMVEKALAEGMTLEQREIIESSKMDQEGIDKEKLAQAEALCAQIEAESYSKFDVDFDSQIKKKNWQSTDEEILNDDQLANLFTEMKKENHAHKIAQMEKIQIEKQASGEADALLDEFNDELEALRGEDSPDDGLLHDVGNQYLQGQSPGKMDPALIMGALESEDEEDEEEEAITHYSPEFKQQIIDYREQERLNRLNRKTVESNLAAIFENFQVVTHQRHKIDLETIRSFEKEKETLEEEDEENQNKFGLVQSIFSHINPFSQFVIQEINEENEHIKTTDPENKIWKLDENLFKRTPDHVVNPDNLKKSSPEMFTIYKYYESPALKVQCQHYTQNEDFVEVRELIPKTTFFSTPVVLAETASSEVVAN